MRAMRVICDVRFKGETRERRESRDPREVTESAYAAAARTHGVKIDAPGGSNGVGIGATFELLCKSTSRLTYEVHLMLDTCRTNDID
jgi:hypothetical protein